MRALLILVLLGGAAAADPAPEGSRDLLDAYLVTVAATSGPAITGAIIAGEQDHGTRATVGGIIGLAGLTLGPSAGHWYCGEGVTPGLVMRVGAFVGIAGLAVADPHGENGLTWLGIFSAAGLFATGMIWDGVTLPRAVRRTHVVPVITGNGLALAGRF